MKYTISEIEVGDKTLSSIEVDYDGYDYDIGSITVGEKEYTSTKVYGIEEEENEGI